MDPKEAAAEFLADAGSRLRAVFRAQGEPRPSSLDVAHAARMLFQGGGYPAEVLMSTVTVMIPETAERYEAEGGFPPTMDLEKWVGIGVQATEDHPILYFPDSHSFLDVNFGSITSPHFAQFSLALPPSASTARIQFDHPNLGRIVWQQTNHRPIPAPRPIAALVADELLRAMPKP